MLDLEPLLAETQSMPPCGVELDYDAEFLELEDMATEKPMRQFEKEQVEPPWREVLVRAAALLQKSKDLRLALMYSRAACQVDGVKGFHAGLRLLLGLLERYWDGLYPLLDADENNDPALRANVLAALADRLTPFGEHATLLRDLRTAEVCRVPGDRLTVRQILIAHGKFAAPEGEPVLPLQVVQGVLGKALEADPAALSDAISLPQTVEALASLINERFGSQNAPSLAGMLSITQNLAAICRSVAANKGIPGAADPSPHSDRASAIANKLTGDETAAIGVTGMPVTPVPSAPDSSVALGVQRLATREDAMAMLEAVCTFLERTEPTNPAPLLIRRARLLMGKDFIGIMQDLAPDSLGQIYQILGREPE
ncbi:type VI secretion system protein TssA [Paraburkholderia flagellata]|uniref:type VI secretion system protein TssA n=1 Tax=Paraburkholderia flagellata TaxID=2883241 RepID=UPI001F34B887|nr:type VI secretion system protein TssA [Paraburkholderia flagellata]